MKCPVYIIAATDENGGIGKNGRLPWHLRKDMKFFRETTTETRDTNKRNMVVMGRKTWESIPEKFRPLPGRKNIVLTKNAFFRGLPGMQSRTQDFETANSFEHALSLADETIEKIFIMGGAKVFEEAVRHPDVSGIYLTKIGETYDCDTFFPEIPEKFQTRRKIGMDKEKNTRLEFSILMK